MRICKCEAGMQSYAIQMLAKNDAGTALLLNLFAFLVPLELFLCKLWGGTAAIILVIHTATGKVYNYQTLVEYGVRACVDVPMRLRESNFVCFSNDARCVSGFVRRNERTTKKCA